MGELLAAFHFSQPGWLWALLLCVPVAAWLLLSRHLAGSNDRIRQYADAHLLPHLLGRSTASSRTQWQRYARWLLSLIHISEPTRPTATSRKPSSA